MKITKTMMQVTMHGQFHHPAVHGNGFRNQAALQELDLSMDERDQLRLHIYEPGRDGPVRPALAWWLHTAKVTVKATTKSVWILPLVIFTMLQLKLTRMLERQSSMHQYKGLSVVNRQWWTVCTSCESLQILSPHPFPAEKVWDKTSV